MGLQIHLAARRFPTGPARDLREKLIGSFRRAQIAARQAKIRINYPDKRQIREMISFRDYLRPDQDINLPSIHGRDKLRRGARTIQGIACHHRHFPIREQAGRFFRQPFDPRPTRFEAVLCPAFTAAFRDLCRIAAVMTLQPIDKTVLHQPGAAIRTLQAVAA